MPETTVQEALVSFHDLLVSQRIKLEGVKMSVGPVGGREVALCVTKLEEAEMWLKRAIVLVDEDSVKAGRETTDNKTPQE